MLLNSSWYWVEFQMAEEMIKGSGNIENYIKNGGGEEIIFF